MGKVHRSEFGSKKACGGESLDLLGFAHAFDALSDVDERWHHGIAWAKNLGHPCTDVWACDGLGGHVTGVPMILVARVEDASEVGLEVASNEGAAIED